MKSEYEKAIEKAEREAAKAARATLTVDERIKLLNTPYGNIPDMYRPGMTKWPYRFEYMKMQNPGIGQQVETFGARLLRFMKNHGVSPVQLSMMASEYGAQFFVKVTLRDIYSYIDRNVAPKIDKLMAISAALDMPLDYFPGYGSSNRISTKFKKAS